MDYLGKNIPKLGFGFMRLPVKGEVIDIDETKAMADLFLQKGFTYFDTAYGYHNGKSEEAIKAAVVDRFPRESFQLATKLPAWAAKSEDEAKAMFWTSLKRTGAGYFDFYLLHNLGGSRTVSFERYGIWAFLEERKKEGLIRNLGFSFHDKADVLDRALREHPDMDFVQLQINYADWESKSIESRKCYETARKHGKPVIVMEPVKGGSLVKMPDALQNIFKEANPKVSSASWAIRFGASLDAVITVLSGMSSLDQMRDNLATMENFKPLDMAEREVIRKVQKALDAVPAIPCTDCRYCVKDCPKGVKIPWILRALNHRSVFNDPVGSKGSYFWETKPGGKASECIACGKCEEVCPQSIPIIENLKKAAELFE